MGVYSRFKKDPEGFRHLVELIESTPTSRRKRMIEVGMEEDSEYTQKALDLVLNFNDVLQLPDLELAEVLYNVPGRIIGLAVYNQSEEVKLRFLSKSPIKSVPDVKEAFEMTNVTPGQISAGQAKLIEETRKAERKGFVKTKRIT